jgi:hypothetical protein
MHATIESANKRIEKQKQISTVTVKTKVQDTEPKEMQQFWEYAKKVIEQKPYCWECGDFISPKDYRASTAHIFPKSIFPSIASNKYNFLVLGNRCGCHNQSHRLDTFSKMRIFPTAINRFMKFAEEIKENHKYKNTFIELLK